MSEASWIALATIAISAVLGPLLLDIRRANREAEARQEETRQAAAELAAKAHSEALDAKDREISYWRDLAMDLLLQRRGERLPSGPEPRR